MNLLFSPEALFLLLTGANALITTPRPFSRPSVVGRLKATVEGEFVEDLDDALEHLLGDVVRDVDGVDSNPSAGPQRTMRRAPAPASLFENVSR